MLGLQDICKIQRNAACASGAETAAAPSVLDRAEAKVLNVD